MLDSCLQVLATEPMQEAQYFRCGSEMDPASRRHYALNIPYYTHFTSPIRRYADVCFIFFQFRIFFQSGHNDESTNEKMIALAYQHIGRSIDDIEKVAEHCNEKKTASKSAQDESDKVFFAVWLRNKYRSGNPVETLGIVLSMGEKYFRIFMPQFGYDQQVTWQDIQPDAELIGFTGSEHQRCLIRLLGDISSSSVDNEENKTRNEKQDNTKEKPEIVSSNNTIDLQVLRRLKVCLTANVVKTRLKISILIRGVWDESKDAYYS
eukprot:GSMAST32.ASY1.ANO1.1186.1 assembled CDS